MDALGFERGDTWRPDFAAMNAAIRSALVDADNDAEYRVAMHPTRQPRPPAVGPGQTLTDLWLITLVVQTSLSIFFTGFLECSGADAYERLEQLVRRLRGAPSKAAQAMGTVQIRPEAGGQRWNCLRA